MASVTMKTSGGKDAGSLELDADVFGIQPNVPVMHQVVTAQLAARRAGTQSTKTRAEVSGGGKKPFKQKGTGNARQASIRAPHYSGGGVALRPKPRKYDQKTPKKMIKLALRSALSDRAAEGKVVVVESGLGRPEDQAGRVGAVGPGVDGKALVVVDTNDVNAIRSFLNLPQVQLIEVGELNAYDVLCNDYVVFTKATLPSGTAIGGRHAAGHRHCGGSLRPRQPRPHRGWRGPRGLRHQGQRRFDALPPPRQPVLRGHRGRGLVRHRSGRQGRRVHQGRQPCQEGRRGRRPRPPTTPAKRASDEGPRDIILAPVVSEKSYALMEQGVTRSRCTPAPASPRSTTLSRPSGA
ncbi:MAG: 50S ribosomal protein L4 [Ilumatobacteraceae bacterium]